MAEMAPVIEGKPDVTRMTEIDLAELGRKFRMQKIAFEAARDVFDLMKPAWKGSREYLLAQFVGLVERYSSRIESTFRRRCSFRMSCAGGSFSRSA